MLLHSESIENRLILKENELENTIIDLSESLKWRKKYFDALKGEEIATKIMTKQIEILGQESESSKNFQKIEKRKNLELMNQMKENLHENFELKKVIKKSESLRIDNENLNMLYLTVKMEVEESVNQITDLKMKLNALEKRKKILEMENLNNIDRLKSKNNDDIEKEKEKERERELFAERLAVVRR